MRQDEPMVGGGNEQELVITIFSCSMGGKGLLPAYPCAVMKAKEQKRIGRRLTISSVSLHY